MNTLFVHVVVVYNNSSLDTGTFACYGVLRVHFHQISLNSPLKLVYSFVDGQISNLHGIHGYVDVAEFLHGVNLLLPTLIFALESMDHIEGEHWNNKHSNCVREYHLSRRGCDI